MAGHSQFKNIMHRKGRQDAQRAKIFTKLIREITTAARLGAADPNANPRLRAAMIAARENNMTRDTIDRAIKRGSGIDADANYDEVRYEGYGPGGVALIVEALTNNRNRTAGEVRSSFSKYGGNLGETNSVSFMFDRLGEFRFPLAVGTADDVLEKAIEAGADDVVSGEGADGMHEIYCAQENFNAVREALEKSLGQPSAAKLMWRPKTTDAGRGRDRSRRCSTSSPPSKTTTTSRTSTPISRCRTTLWRSSRPEAPAMRLIGLDPGLRLTGWGVIEVEGNRLRHVAHGVVRVAATGHAGRAAAGTVRRRCRHRRGAAAARGGGRGDLREHQCRIDAEARPGARRRRAGAGAGRPAGVRICRQPGEEVGDRRGPRRQAPDRHDGRPPAARRRGHAPMPPMRWPSRSATPIIAPPPSGVEAAL